MEDEIINLDALIEKTYKQNHDDPSNINQYRDGFVEAVNLLNNWQDTTKSEYPKGESWVLGYDGIGYNIVSYDPESLLWIDKDFKVTKVLKWKYIFPPT